MHAIANLCLDGGSISKMPIRSLVSLNVAKSTNYAGMDGTFSELVICEKCCDG